MISPHIQIELTSNIPDPLSKFNGNTIISNLAVEFSLFRLSIGHGLAHRIWPSENYLSGCSGKFFLAAGAVEVVGVVDLAAEPQWVTVWCVGGQEEEGWRSLSPIME